MSKMPAHLHGSVVPVVSTANRGAPKLFATGIVISPTAVITCRHAIEKSRTPDAVEGSQTYAARNVLCGSAVCRSTRARGSNQWDLCCLYFDALPGAAPAPLFRAARVEGVKLAAAGFKPDLRGPRQHWTPKLETIHEEQYEGRLQFAQFRGGCPVGFSGAPVLAACGDVWRVVGMLVQGGEDSATSRMIAADVLAAFLAEEGIELAVGDLPPSVEPAGKLPGGVSVRVGRDIKKSAVEMNGANLALDVGRDVSGTKLRLKGGSSKKK